jgi:hypothetical protein
MYDVIMASLNLHNIFNDVMMTMRSQSREEFRGICSARVEGSAAFRSLLAIGSQPLVRILIGWILWLQFSFDPHRQLI